MKNRNHHYIFQRGKNRTYYVRRRIPQPLRALYSGRREVVRSLRTADFRDASSRAAFELASIAGRGPVDFKFGTSRENSVQWR